MNKDQYAEVQKIDSLWPLLLFTITMVFNWVMYFYLDYADLNLFYVSVLSVGLLSTFLLMLRLYTRVDAGGVHYRFFPFHFRWHNIGWKEIAKIDVRQYSPWSEYGGWGLRWGKSGWAYIISGKSGLQLLMKDNKKILIGTVNPDVMIGVVRRYKEA
jgi:hypothetical protein